MRQNSEFSTKAPMHKNAARPAVCRIVVGLLRSQRHPGLVITAHLPAQLVGYPGALGSCADGPELLFGAWCDGCALGRRSGSTGSVCLSHAVWRPVGRRLQASAWPVSRSDTPAACRPGSSRRTIVAFAIWDFLLLGRDH